MLSIHLTCISRIGLCFSSNATVKANLPGLVDSVIRTRSLSLLDAVIVSGAKKGREGGGEVMCIQKLPTL